MQAIMYPVAPARERRFVIVALVGALHIAAIYTILVALDIVPPPIPSTVTKFAVLAPTPTKPQLQSHPVVLLKPVGPTAQKPVIDVVPDPHDNPINIPQIDTPPGPTDTFVPASALAGTHSTPDYPTVDRRLTHEGAVQLALSIDAQGTVTGATVEKSSGYVGLDAAAVAWVKAYWRYKPALHNGTAVPTTTKASVIFRLTQAPY
jgi:TonB family protein